MSLVPVFERPIALWLAAPALLAAGLAPAQAPSPAEEIRTAIGVTRQGTPIRAFITTDDLDYRTPKARLLLIGGLDGGAASVAAVRTAWRKLRAAETRNFAFSAVPDARPDSEAAAGPSSRFPPSGDAYRSGTDPEAQYLWRWIGMHAPDLVVEVTEAESAPGSLSFELPRGKPSGVGAVPASAVAPAKLSAFLDKLLAASKPAPSAARREIQRRIARTPIEVATELSRVYGRRLDTVAYIPALALVGRLRLGELTADPEHLRQVERIVEPYRTDAKPTFGDSVTGSHISGHLVFGELAQRTGDPRYVELARRAADYAFNSDSSMKQAMPFHREMSDSVFMGCAILAQAGRLTGEDRYFEMALRHLRFMRRLDLRPDGLYRHSPLDEAAWGRGNGFPALGLALSLTYLPHDHRGRAEMLAAYRAHMEALLARQDPTGAWHQVVDRPESYRELTSTSMIAFAMLRGLRNGWLEDGRHRAADERAWEAVKARIGPDGALVDVCTSTGKQKSLRDYYERKAILGRDDRGGAMALMFSTEMAAWVRGQDSEPQP